LAGRPGDRTRGIEDEHIIEVRRIAEQVLYPNENVMNVNYTVWVRDEGSNGIEEIKETHRMRYLFVPEIVPMLKSYRFALVETGE
jgi:hypothetical protein